MAQTVADQFAEILVAAGVKRIYGIVGDSLNAAREKVTGRAEYTHTMRLPGMLQGKIFRSTVAHGRIKSIDTSAAKKVPEVKK